MLAEPGVPKSKLAERAKALRSLGRIFQVLPNSKECSCARSNSGAFTCPTRAGDGMCRLWCSSLICACYVSCTVECDVGHAAS